MMMNGCIELSAALERSYPVSAGEPRTETGSLHKFLSAKRYGENHDNRWKGSDIGTLRLFGHVYESKGIIAGPQRENANQNTGR